MPEGRTYDDCNYGQCRSCNTASTGRNEKIGARMAFNGAWSSTVCVPPQHHLPRATRYAAHGGGSGAEATWQLKRVTEAQTVREWPLRGELARCRTVCAKRFIFLPDLAVWLTRCFSGRSSVARTDSTLQYAPRGCCAVVSVAWCGHHVGYVHSAGSRGLPNAFYAAAKATAASAVVKAAQPFIAGRLFSPVNTMTLGSVAASALVAEKMRPRSSRLGGGIGAAFS